MLSVAICTYNGESFIKEQLSSIMYQSCPVDEIVVCDDGSTDRTLEIIKDFQTQTRIEIHIYQNEQQLGVCTNFQKAINLCRGDIIFLSDQDDIWKRDKVETIVQYFSRNKHIKVVFTNGQLINSNGVSVENKTLWDCFGLTQQCLMHFCQGFGVEIFSYENRATGATMAIRNDFEYRSSFIEYCNKEILHDGAIAMMALSNNQLGYINKCLINYRIHNQQGCGVGKYLIKPMSDNLYLVSYLAASWCKLQLPKSLKNRIAFLANRERQQHKAFGAFRMIYSVHSYHMFYGEKWYGFICYDIKQWASSVWNFLIKTT